MNQLTIYIVDDIKEQQDTVESLIKEAIRPYKYSRSNIKTKKFFWPHIKPQNKNTCAAYDMIESENPHIIFSDITWDTEGVPKSPQFWGIEFAKKVKEEYPNIVFQLITCNPNNSEQTNASIAGFDTINKADKINREEQIRRCFLEATKCLVTRLNSKIKSNLYKLIIDKDISSFNDIKINLDKKEWYAYNIFLTCYKDNTPDWEILMKLVKPNLTLAASECFGINGIKQATHSLAQGFYIGPDGWYNNILTQVDHFIKTIEETNKFTCINIIDKFPVLKQYLDNIKNFRKKTVKINNNHELATKSLPQLRNKYFSFGTSRKRKKFKIGKKDITRNDKINPKQGNEFEIYLPVHEIFKSEFKTLYDNCDSIKHHTWQSNEVYPLPQTWNVDSKRPKIFKDYLVFNQRGEPYPCDAIQRLPECFEVFRNKHFEFFGNMYLVLKRQNGQIEINDCTYEQALPKTSDYFDKTLTKYLEENNDTTAYFIFEFNSWRQP
jgi:hypothetical protein